MAEASVTITLRSAVPSADDVLTVTGDIAITFGADTYAATVTTTGWVSATRQHYSEDDYTETDQGRQLVDGARPRAMDPDEIRAYCGRLVLDAFVASTPLVRRAAADLLALDADAAPVDTIAEPPTPTMTPTGAAPALAPSQGTPNIPPDAPGFGRGDPGGPQSR